MTSLSLSSFTSCSPTLRPPVSGTIPMPSARRCRRNRSNTSFGLSSSATALIRYPLMQSQCPAASQFPMCGSAMMMPCPPATPWSMVSIPSQVNLRFTSSGGIVRRAKVSYQ